MGRKKGGKEGLDSRRTESKKCRFVMIGGRGNDAVGFRRRMMKGWTFIFKCWRGGWNDTWK